jgi:hypothetical protein
MTTRRIGRKNSGVAGVQELRAKIKIEEKTRSMVLGLF